uniref:Uncharacterized protein n=1 Tax=Glossina austeni TaxID=7395 RepID=A0A1A9UE45_GLOAU
MTKPWEKTKRSLLDVLVMDVNEFFEELLQEVDEIIGTRSKQQTQNTGQIDAMSTKFLDGFLVDEEGVKRKLKAKHECDGNLAKRHKLNSLDSFLAHNKLLKNVSTQTDDESIFELRGLNIPVQTSSRDTDVGGRTIKNDILIKLKLNGSDGFSTSSKVETLIKWNFPEFLTNNIRFWTLGTELRAFSVNAFKVEILSLQLQWI